MTSSVLRNQAIKLQLSDCKCKISEVLLAYHCPPTFLSWNVCARWVCVCVCVCVMFFTVGGQISLEKVMVPRCLFFKQKKKKLKKSNSQIFVYHLTWSSLSQNFLLSEKFFSPVNIAFIKRSHWSLVDFVTRGTSLASLCFIVWIALCGPQKIYKGPLAICWFVCIGF